MLKKVDLKEQRLSGWLNESLNQAQPQPLTPTFNL